MENSEEKKIDDILKDIHNDFMDYFDNIDIPKEGSTSFRGMNFMKFINKIYNKKKTKNSRFCFLFQFFFQYIV